MQPPSFFRFIGLVAFALSCALDLTASEAKEQAAPKKKPELRVDSSPVSDGKSGVVTSYADVVEPVQKAVVSIYSTKIVRERVQINPLFRQLFPGLPDQERESKQEGLGSGVIVSADGYIITNSHVIEGADELKVKETDRIHSMKENLCRMGARIDVMDGDIVIEGVETLRGAEINSYDDHRTCMAMTVAALKAQGSSSIDNIDCINKSFPEFFEVLGKVTLK